MFTRLGATLAVVCVAAVSGSASGGFVVAQYGDTDGFGFGAPQDVDGALWVTDFGGVFFTDYRDAGDLATAPQTDIWDSNFGILGNPFNITYTPPGVVTEAIFRIYIAGVADVGPVNVLADGQVIGTIDFRGQFQTTHVLEFNVPLALIDGDTTFQLDHFTGAGDGYIMDYARLTIIPAPAVLASFALAGLLGRRRRRV